VQSRINGDRRPDESTPMRTGGFPLTRGRGVHDTTSVTLRLKPSDTRPRAYSLVGPERSRSCGFPSRSSDAKRWGILAPGIDPQNTWRPRPCNWLTHAMESSKAIVSHRSQSS
jgi:hypothetical protein